MLTDGRAEGFVSLPRRADLSLFSKPLKENDMHAETIDTGIETLLSDMRKQLANDENVGGTVSLIGQQRPTTGYMVGGYVDSLIFDQELLNHGNVAWNFITQFVSLHSAFATRYDVFLGGWLDTEDGNVYIDLSIRFENRTAAIHDATANEEIAIWDLAKDEEIRLP